MDRQHLISFASFSDEFQKIAQDKAMARAKGIGALAGGVGGAALAREALKDVKNPRLRLLAALTAGSVGALGGKEVGQATLTAGRGARTMGQVGKGTAQSLRYSVSE